MTFLTTLALSLIFVTADTARVKELITIPLEEVAGLGGRGLRVLEPELFVRRDTPEKYKKYSTPEGIAEMKRLAKKSLVQPIEQALQEITHWEKKPSAGFAVSGRDRDALPDLHRVLAKQEKPKGSFTPQEEVSIFFFTQLTTPHVRIKGIERTGNVFKIKYMLIPRNYQIQTSINALIPCGKLPIDKYKVEMHRVPVTAKETRNGEYPPTEADLEKLIVCLPFSFVVSDQSSQSVKSQKIKTP